MFAVIYSFVLALFVSTALVPLLVRWAKPLGMVDHPGERKVHQVPIPRIGGVAIVAGTLLPLYLWLPPNPQLHAYLLGAAIMAVLGILDDRFDLDYRVKFLGQIAAVLVVMWLGEVVIRRFPFLPEDVLLPDLVAFPLTLFFVVGVTNAINLADGLDGLAGGMSVIAIGALALLAYYDADLPALMAAVAIVGAVLGFLRFNTHPARIFMGDTGSQFLGFSAGVLAVILCGLPTSAVSPVLPLLILGVPILDTLSVMTRRFLDGRPPFVADRGHIHHKLMDRGLTQYETVVVIYGAQFALAVTAVLLAYQSDWLLAGIYVTFALFGVGFLRMARLLEWSDLGWHRQRSPVNTLVGYLRRSRLVTRYAYLGLALMVPLFLLLGSLLALQVDSDFGLIALAGFVAIAIMWRFFPSYFPFALRFVGFVAAAFIAYLVEANGGMALECGRCLHLFFAVMALLVAVWVRLSDSREFSSSTLDYLIVAIVFVVPNLDLAKRHSLVGVVAIELVILFYALEVLISRKGGPPRWLAPVVATSLGVLAFRGML